MCICIRDYEGASSCVYVRFSSVSQARRTIIHRRMHARMLQGVQCAAAECNRQDGSSTGCDGRRWLQAAQSRAFGEREMCFRKEGRGDGREKMMARRRKQGKQGEHRQNERRFSLLSSAYGVPLSPLILRNLLPVIGKRRGRHAQRQRQLLLPRPLHPLLLPAALLATDSFALFLLFHHCVCN